MSSAKIDGKLWLKEPKIRNQALCTHFMSKIKQAKMMEKLFIIKFIRMMTIISVIVLEDSLFFFFDTLVR